MPWLIRGEKRYFYRSIRVDGKPVKHYVGSGVDAEQVARLVELRNIFRERDRILRSEFLDFSHQLELLIDPWIWWVQYSSISALTKKGYHRLKRGNWRKRRCRMQDEKQVEKRMDRSDESSAGKASTQSSPMPPGKWDLYDAQEARFNQLHRELVGRCISATCEEDIDRELANPDSMYQSNRFPTHETEAHRIFHEGLTEIHWQVEEEFESQEEVIADPQSDPTPVLPTPAEIESLIQRARDGDRAVLPELETILVNQPELIDRVSRAWFERLVAMVIPTIAGSNLLLELETLFRLGQLRQELIQEGNGSVLDRLNVDNTIACHFLVQAGEERLARMGDGESENPATTKAIRERLLSDQLKYQRAMKHLITMRKLLKG